MVGTGDGTSSLELVVGGIAHEIRGPLATIAALAEQCRDEAAGAPHAEPAARILEEANRLERLLTSLLDVLVAGADAAAGRAGWCLLEEVVDGALRTVGIPRAEVRLDVPRTLPLVWAEPVLAERILANLLANAERHGRPPVEITARLRFGRVELTVADAGPGMGAAGSTSNGHGLGLALSMRLAHLQGLELRIPGDGEGARFRLTFPRVMPDEGW